MLDLHRPGRKEMTIGGGNVRLNRRKRIAGTKVVYAQSNVTSALKYSFRDYNDIPMQRGQRRIKDVKAKLESVSQKYFRSMKS